MALFAEKTLCKELPRLLRSSTRASKFHVNTHLYATKNKSKPCTSFTIQNILFRMKRDSWSENKEYFLDSFKRISQISGTNESWF